MELKYTVQGKYFKIADWIIKWNINELETNEFNYPDKIDAFSATDSFEKINLEVQNNLVKENILKQKIDNSHLLFHDKTSFMPYDIYKKDNNYLWIQNNSAKHPIIAFEIDKDFRQCNLIWDVTNTNGKYVFEYFGRIFPYFALTMDSIVLHGVLMEYHGKGIIISAPSGTGKTTHARMWRDYKNTLIVNGDKSLCVKKNGRWTGYGMPWCGTSGEYINRSVGIQAVVILEQSESNSIQRLSTFDGFKRSIQNVLFPTWDSSLNIKAIDLLNDIVNSVPVYNLKCRPDLESVEILERELNRT